VGQEDRRDGPHARGRQVHWTYTVGYSDYDVFLENDRGSWVYWRKKLFLDIFVKHVFQNFEPFLANRASKFQKSANMM
jgi:hypothetical protein